MDLCAHCLANRAAERALPQPGCLPLMSNGKQAKLHEAHEVATLRRTAASTASDPLYRRDITSAERPCLVKVEKKQCLWVLAAAPPIPCAGVFKSIAIES
jgi:hypothetical protein